MLLCSFHPQWLDGSEVPKVHALRFWMQNIGKYFNPYLWSILSLNFISKKTSNPYNDIWKSWKISSLQLTFCVRGYAVQFKIPIFWPPTLLLFFIFTLHSAIVVGNDNSSIHIDAVIDPLSLSGQKLSSILRVLSKYIQPSMRIILNPMVSCSKPPTVHM